MTTQRYFKDIWDPIKPFYLEKKKKFQLERPKQIRLNLKRLLEVRKSTSKSASNPAD